MIIKLKTNYRAKINGKIQEFKAGQKLEMKDSEAKELLKKDLAEVSEVEKDEVINLNGETKEGKNQRDELEIEVTNLTIEKVKLTEEKEGLIELAETLIKRLEEENVHGGTINSFRKKLEKYEGTEEVE